MAIVEPLEGQEPASVPPQVALTQMASASAISQALYVAAKLGIADQMKQGPKSCDALAQAVEVDRRALYRLLRALASVGVFAQDGNEHFALTPLAEYLQTDVPGSLRAIIIMSGEDWHWRAWGALLQCVKTGNAAFRHLFGTDLYHYLSQNPEAAMVFNAGMANFAAGDNAAVVGSYDFGGVGKIVDVGGGFGTLMPSILKMHPTSNGVLFDLPPVIEALRRLIETEGIADHCELIAGDFFESVPPGGEVYILKYILHNWDDERAVTILKNCHRAMETGSRLLLVETVMPPHDQSPLSTFLDLEMLVTTPGGRVRTEAEFWQLLNTSGFKLTEVIPTPSGMCVIEGVCLAA